jgi:recombinational DNA repair protein (RecF pathway)
MELDSQKLEGDQFDCLGFVGLVLDQFLPENVAEPKIFEDLSKYLQSDFSEETTRFFILLVLERLGFSGKKQRKLSYDKLKLFVDQILDRA